MNNRLYFKGTERPSHLVNGIQIIDVSVYSNRTLYASSLYDSATNTLIYIATSSEADTVEIMKTLEFNDLR